MRRLAASRFSLARACAYWLRPEVTLADDAPSETSDTGKLGHALFDVALLAQAYTLPQNDPSNTREWQTVAVEVAQREALLLADVPKAARMAAAWERWWPGFAAAHKGVTWRSEVPILYDIAEGTACEVADPAAWFAAGRPREDGETVAILDLHGIGSDGALYVYDYKTGSKRESAAESGQLALCALAAWTLAGRPAGVRIVAGNVYVKLRDPWQVDAVEWSTLDMMDVDDELRALEASYRDAQPVEGRHCWQCRARGNCPAKRDSGFFTYGEAS